LGKILEMGRIRSKYNYRIRKTKKNPKAPIKRLEKKDEVVEITRKNRKEKIILSRKKGVNNKAKKIFNDKKNFDIRKNRPVPKGGKTATLDQLKDYFSNSKVLIVGNSSEVTTKNLGKKIDSYQVVIRLNFGLPIQKYEVHMGRKMSIWGHGIKSYKSQMTLYKRCITGVRHS
jgi:hypothetical protein